MHEHLRNTLGITMKTKYRQLKRNPFSTHKEGSYNGAMNEMVETNQSTMAWKRKHRREWESEMVMLWVRWKNCM